MVDSTKNKKTVKKVEKKEVEPKKTTTKRASAKAVTGTKTTSTAKKKTTAAEKKEVKTTKTTSKIARTKAPEEKKTSTRGRKATVKSTETKPKTVKKTEVKTKTETPRKTTVKKETNKTVEKTISSKANLNSSKTKKTDSKIILCCNFIKKSFFDVYLLYRNFFHWNISKIIIMVWSIILGFLAIIPIVLLFFGYSFVSDVNMSMLLEGMFRGTLFNDFYGNLILMLIVAVFVVVYSYSNILLINLSNGYLENKSLAFKQNDYFKFKKIVKYFNLTVINFLILLIPFMLFALLMGVLFLFSGSFEEILALVSSSFFNYFTILSYIFFVGNVVLLIYLFYRIVFSYYILSDSAYDDKKAKSISYVKESLVKTKSTKNFFKFLLIILIFLIITLPIKFVGVILENNVNMLTDYSIYKTLTQEQKDTFIPANKEYYFNSIELEFSSYTDQEIASKINKNKIYMYLYGILIFLFLNGLFVMVFASFYRRELN